MQEALYHCLPEVFPCIIYANTNIPEKLFRVLRSQKEVGDLRDGSNNLFQRNMLDRYVDRPDESFFHGRCCVLNKFCYAEFKVLLHCPGSKQNRLVAHEIKEQAAGV